MEAQHLPEHLTDASYKLESRRTTSAKVFLSLRICAIAMAGAPPSTCFRVRTMKVRSTLKPAMPSSWSSACSSIAGLSAAQHLTESEAYT